MNRNTAVLVFLVDLGLVIIIIVEDPGIISRIAALTVLIHIVVGNLKPRQTRYPSEPVPSVEGPIDIGVIVALREEFGELYSQVKQLASPEAVKDDDTGAYDYLFTWSVDSDSPAFVMGAIASGPVEAVAESFVAWVRSTNRNYLGLEMESGGVLAAVYGRADPTRSLVLRGVSDFGDVRKKELDAIGTGGLRRYAMRNAVHLLWGLLEAQELPRAK